MSLTFQHLHTSRSTDKNNHGNMYFTLYGRTEDGRSCAARVHNVHAYAYVHLPFSNRTKHTLDKCLIALLVDQKRQYCSKHGKTFSMQKSATYHQGSFKPDCYTIDVVEGFNIRHVYPPALTLTRFKTKKYNIYNILKRFFGNVQHHVEIINEICNVTKLDRPLNVLQEFKDARLYESMFKPEAVWLIDNHLPSCSWMKCDFQHRSDYNENTDITGTASSIRAIHRSSMAPYRILSYDIEAQPGQDGSFPQPERDPIITIGVVCFTAINTNIQKHVFMYEPDSSQQNTSFDKLENPPDDYDPSDTVIHSYHDEYTMLQDFVEFIVKTYDPDIITGYNIMNFDNVYLMKRIKHLCPSCDGDEKCVHDTCKKTRQISRVNKITTLRAVYKESNQKGGHETYDAFLEGREWFDLYDVIKNDHKLRSYKLDEVAKHFLGTKKIHIRYEDIPEMQKTKEGRAKLAIYCVKDSYLVYKLIIKLCKMTNAIQMSQVTGVALRDILHRGQQCRTIALMLQAVKKRPTPRWYLPEENGNNTDSFEGAVVITPKPGYYDRPVATLDFASLYPSIMRAYNMCYSTMIPSPKLARQRGYNWSEEYEKPQWKNGDDPPDFRPVRHFKYEGYNFEYLNDENKDICFLTTKQRKGILPEILESLLSERKRVKKMMKQVNEHSTEYQVYNGRQLALKVCANSVYGFTGAGKGYLSEKRISSSVTRVGRAMANYTKWKCETEYRDQNVQVVYGDTDSVFVHLPKSICDGKNDEEILARSFELGEKMAELCTNEFLLPNELEFEKVYYPLLLKGKKRYAGQKYEPGLKPKMDVKGFECVRRDFAPIVSKTQKECFIRLLTQKNMQSCVDYARQRVIDLLTGQVELDELQLSKQLTRKPEAYKNPASHVKLAIRLIRELPEHLAPKTGDRIDYFIRTGFEKVCDRAVTREDIETGRAVLDSDWYLENQLKQPLFRVFEMIMNNPQDIFKRSHIRRHVRKTSLFQNKTNFTDKVVADSITIEPYKPSKTKKLFNAPPTRRKKRKSVKVSKAVVSKNIKDFF